MQGSPTRELRSQANIPGCLSSEAVKRKGDFVFQTGHVIEIVTKLFLVVQNATGKPPSVNINTQFDANFGTHSVTFQFKVGGLPSSFFDISSVWVRTGTLDVSLNGGLLRELIQK